MGNVRVAFEVLSDGKLVPVGIKMEDFRQKASLMAGGHMTEAPATIMYANIVLRETIRIVLMIDALNVLEVKSGDIFNAGLHLVLSLVTMPEELWVWEPDMA